MACGLGDLSSTHTLNTSGLRPTETHEIQDDGPLLRRTREDVVVEALDVDEHDENEPEPKRPLRVDVTRSRELELSGDAT